jgi:hypothetical protein
MSDQNADRTMSPLDFTDMSRSITTLIDGVVQTSDRNAELAAIAAITYSDLFLDMPDVWETGSCITLRMKKGRSHG